MRSERELTFAQDDIDLFAEASGDHNPLHVEPELAARSAFGSTVVPGALLAIAMLGTLPDDAARSVRSLRLSFSGPVLPGTTVAVNVGPSTRARGAWELALTGRGKTLVRMRARVARADSVLHQPGDRDARALAAMRTAPAEPSIAELVDAPPRFVEYRIGDELQRVAARWGAESVAPAVLEGLAWASYVVGMEVPGRHGLFSGLELGVGEEAADGVPAPGARQELTVRDYDDRTGQLQIDARLVTAAGTARCVAAIECFELVDTGDPDPAALAPAAADAAPAGSRGLVAVIGGSRGFGAALTLALLGHGHRLRVTYASSGDHAERLVALAGAGRDAIAVDRVDARDAEAMEALAAELRAAGERLEGLVLNAALPPLAMGLTAASGGELAAYLADSVRLAAVPLGALLPLVDRDRGWIVFCSSSALSAPPRDWPHYVAAKGALEGLAGWVAQNAPGIRVVVLRPPKMRTAITSTPGGRLGAASVESVAAWTAARLAGEDLDAGVTVLEPSLAEVRA